MSTEMGSMKILIADDELLARRGLQQRLTNFEQIDILSLCANGTETFEQIIKHRPDAVFLDIEMPGLTGMELLKELVNLNYDLPYIVFTTAYQNFALDAFEFEPCDYLLKPFDQERLDICVKRIEKTLAQRRAIEEREKLSGLLSRKTGKSLDSFIENLEQSSQCQLSELQTRLSFKVGTEWIKVAINDIHWIEAAGDYMCLHLADSQQIIRKTMKQLEVELDESHFPRVSRSAIVNVSKIVKLTPNSNGEYHALLSSGDTVKITRKYKFKLDELRSKPTLQH